MNDFSESISKTAKEFRLNNFMVKLTKTNGEPSGFIFKNTEKYDDTHYHVYQKDNQAFFHQTLEQKGQNSHYPIEHEEMIKKIGKSLEQIFSLAKQIELTDNRFVGKSTILVSNFEIYVKESTNKKVEFGQIYDQDETVFENIDVAKNAVGSLSDNDQETHMVIVQNGLVYVINLDELDKLQLEVDLVMKPIGNNQGSK